MTMRRQFKALLVVSFVSLLVYAAYLNTHNFVSHKRSHEQAHVNPPFEKDRYISAEELRTEPQQSCTFPVPSQSLLPCQQNNLSQTRRIINKSLPWLDLERALNASMTLALGGYHRPVGCASPQRLAMIIPYRGRERNLKILLNNLHRVLQKQQAEYTIFVVEQEDGTPFNRGMIKNIGYVEAKALCHFDCFTFQDVDLVPESERNTYFCGEKALHHSSKFNFQKYSTLYRYHFGGVVTFNNTYFSTINGYSNLFYMWGGEDDDLFHRLRKKNLMFERSPYPRYTALPHKKDPRQTRKEMTIYYSSHKRFDTDGLNSIKRLYRLISVEKHPLYTRIYVSVNQSEVLTQLKHFGIKL